MKKKLKKTLVDSKDAMLTHAQMVFIKEIESGNQVTYTWEQVKEI